MGSDAVSSIKPQFKGNVGMFLVCAELSKYNLIAMPTSRNTKGYDIIVLNPETNKSVGLQIKSTDKKEFPILSSHWYNYIQKIEEKILCDFVFVDISDLEHPNYLILSVKKVKNLLKSVIKRYLINRQEKYNLTLEELLEKEKKEKRKQDLWVIKYNKGIGVRSQHLTFPVNL
jgi:hypothetical protein